MNNPLARRFWRADDFEAAWCIRLNRISRVPVLRDYFRAVSRLGNGMLWYLLIVAIPLIGGSAELPVAGQLGFTAIVGVLLYKFCKKILVRERPFVTHSAIACVGKPLDRGSFPSGHTLHATSFTLLCGVHYPPLLWLLVPLALSIAASRVVLGHHYPSDVLAGAMLGALLAWAGFLLLPI